MTYYEFMLELQKYYGPYENEQVKIDTGKYVKENYYKSELSKLLYNIKKHFSTKWKTHPDIAIIVETEKAFPIIAWGAGGDRIIPPAEKKNEIEYIYEPEGRDDFVKEQREMFEKMKKKADERMQQIRKENEK